MLFNSLQFVAFFLPLFLLFRVVDSRYRLSVLLAGSLLFYSLWVPAYLLLLLSEILVNYALLRLIASGCYSRLALTTSIVATLGSLAYFKYAALLIETAMPVLRGIVDAPINVPEIFLPLGISFFSFQIVALAVDTYRDPESAPQSLSRYALFISFFPQLIAGPILRGPQLLPQLEAGPRFSADRNRRGIALCIVGLVKKVVFADFLLAPFVDRVFESPGTANASFHWVAMYGFSFQIYFDFSGYSDIARGLGLLMGFELPLNFREPFLSRNPSEFWRRWHITLSQWLRDYLYVPLGGNRRGRFRVNLNLLLTMLLGGMWHGAAWTFLMWGGLHGLLLVFHRIASPIGRKVDGPFQPLDIIRIPAMMTFVAMTFVIFRSPDIASAAKFLQSLAAPSDLRGWPVFETVVLVLFGLLHALERWLRPRYMAARRRWLEVPGGVVIEGLAIGAALAVVLLCSGKAGEFIYFQF